MSQGDEKKEIKMRANVQIGQVEVSVEDVLGFVSKVQTVSFNGADVLVLATIVGEYVGTANLTTIKDTFEKVGVKFV